MALVPSVVSGNEDSYYFTLTTDTPAPQVLSQSGNTVSLSEGGGSVDIAATTSVASSALKTTAITYDDGLLETNVAGVLNVGLGSAIGSTRVEGGKVVISRTDAPPKIELVDEISATTAEIQYTASSGLRIGGNNKESNILCDGGKTQINSVVDNIGNGVIDIYCAGVAPGKPVFIRADAGSGFFKAAVDSAVDFRVTAAATAALTSFDNGPTAGVVLTAGAGENSIIGKGNPLRVSQGESAPESDNFMLMDSAGISLSAPDIKLSVANAAGVIKLEGGTSLITNVPPIGITGNYLVLTINNVAYKIALVV